MARKREARKEDGLHNPATKAHTKPSTTAELQLAYVRNTHAIELLAASEEARRYRCRALLLQDELDDLNDKLWNEQERGEEAEVDAEKWQQRAEERAGTIEAVTGELRSKTRELDMLRTELSSLQSVSSDSTKLLTEKLTLSRDIANMKPELEHLRSEAKANQKLLSEKLAIERQLQTTNAELEDARLTLRRLQATDSTHQSQDSELIAEIQQLKKDLAKAQKDLLRANKTAEKAVESESTQVEELKAELSEQKRERQKFQKAAETARGRAEADWEAQKAVLDDKLSQFRTKLKATKEKLRETETELQEARTTATTVTAKASTSRPGSEVAQTKNPRKRAAAQLDPNAAIGTLGDANKRSKRASSVVGEKSTFSITPFLNRTTSVVPENQQQEAGQDEPLAGVEGAANESPSVCPANAPERIATANASNILGPASAGKSNAKPAARKRAAAPLALEQVAEEEESGDENGRASNEENEDPTGDTTKTTAKEPKKQASSSTATSKPKPTLKPRKSLASFASFREVSLQPEVRGFQQHAVQKKKRRFLGTGAKTLFDDDEEDGESAAGVSALRGLGQKPFGGQRAFGAFGGSGTRTTGGGLGMLGRKGPMMVADGFAFSPLKKERRAMREASRAASEAPPG